MKLNKLVVYRIFLYIIGLNILCIGIVFLIKSNLGTSSWDSINVGVNEKFGISVGTSLIIVNFVTVVVSFILNKKLTSFLSILTGILEGVLIDFWHNQYISQLPNNPPYLSFIYFAMGIILMGLGVGMYIHSKLPINHVDLLMVSVSEKYKLNLRNTKWLIDIIALCIGWLLIGHISIGTIIILLFFGPIIQFFSNIIEKSMEKFTIT